MTSLMKSLLDELDILLQLTAWKYDDQIGLDEPQEEQRQKLYLKLMRALQHC